MSKNHEEETFLTPKKFSETVNVKNLKCRSGKSFLDVASNKLVTLSKLNCSKNVVGDFQKTEEACAAGLGKIYLIGFKINDEFVKQIEICFNDASASLIYSRHKINGMAIKCKKFYFNWLTTLILAIFADSIKESDRRGFLSSAISVKPYDLYTKTFQSEMFKTVLNLIPPSDMYYLSRGHSSPDADFIFTSGQFATYFYLNAMPEFQIINQGNWLKVERLARNVAILERTYIDVITGGHEILSLPHMQTAVRSNLFLNAVGKFIEVPKYIWKILINQRDETAIVLVTSNNPYLANPIDICKNICVDVGLTYPGVLQDNDKGYTICCSLVSFKAVVQNIPTLPDYDEMILKGVTY
jgi:hypothetical protein